MPLLGDASFDKVPTWKDRYSARMRDIPATEVFHWDYEGLDVEEGKNI